MSKVSGICPGVLTLGSWVCGSSDSAVEELSPAMQVCSLSGSYALLYLEGDDSIPVAYPYEMLRPINLTEWICVAVVLFTMIRL